MQWMHFKEDISKDADVKENLEQDALILNDTWCYLK
jgi:hypothetical protein